MKKLIALILTLCLLCGCSLAMLGDGGEGELSGFFVTVTQRIDGEEVEIWDEDAAGMQMISRHDLAGQKLYAQFIGTTTMDYYEFPEGCGMACFTYAIYRDGEAMSRTTAQDPEIAMEHFGLHPGEPLRFEMEAVLYASQYTSADIQVNPVYQTKDGSVYVLGDKPISYRVEGGKGFGTTMTSGAEQDGQTVIRVRVEQIVLPDTYVVIEMDENDNPLRKTEFTPGDLPESYTPGSDAAYLILEALAGEDTVRTVHSPGDEEAALDTYYPGRYGFCIKEYTKIEWEGAK